MPAIVPIAAAAIAVGASAVAAKAGVGKNNSRQGSFDTKPAYDPDKFEWRGGRGWADQDARYYRDAADWAIGRPGEQVDYTGANWDRMQSGVARLGEKQAADLMLSRASGLTPSIAQAQAMHDMGLLQQQGQNANQQMMAAQASQAASARGAAGLALAGQNAAANTATAQSAINQNVSQGMQNISGQAQVNAMNERLQAEQSAMGAYGQMRGGDFQAQGLAANQALSQAQINAQQRALNDQYSLAMHNNELNVRQNQLNAGMNQQQMLANSSTATNQMNAAINQANANREMALFQGAVGAVTGGASTYASMGKGPAK
jgi:hypothetical protein